MGLLAQREWASRDSLVSESNERDVTLDEIEAADDGARTRALAANVLLGVGAAAVVGGVVLLLAGGEPEQDEAVQAAVVPGPGGLCVRIDWGGVR